MAKTPKQVGAILSIGLNSFLILLKLIVGIMSGSVGVIASSVDSLIDLIASGFTFYGITIADAPPDAEHPFGHGKFEDFAGLLEAALIIAGAFFIVWEAVTKLLSPEHHNVQPTAGIIVMLFSLISGLIVSQILFRIAKETESTALNADAHHLNMDVIGSVAVIIGLVLVKVTGNPIFDPIMALIVAGLILWVGIQIIRKTFNHLVDTALPREEEDRIIEIILRTFPSNEPARVQDLRTRRSGSHRLIVFNLQVAPHLTVEQAHQYCDQVEMALEEAFPNSLITIHLEPLQGVLSKTSI